MKRFFTLDLAVEFYKDSKKVDLPVHLKDQFMRASSSIAMNLSEGSSRASEKERKRFYNIALGSLRECQTILELNESSKDILDRADFLGACLYKLYKSKTNHLMPDQDT